MQLKINIFKYKIVIRNLNIKLIINIININLQSMKKLKINLIVIGILVLAFSACNQTSKQIENNSVSQSVSGQIESKSELEKWKKELIDNKLVGKPCDFEVVTDKTQQEKWNEENPDVLDGLLKDESGYGIVNSDFNNDEKEDLLLYFMSENCTGHNGGTPSFAKIVYADGTFNSNIMNDIQFAIIEEYNKKRAIDKNLKEVTTDYLSEEISISYSNNTINGDFSLYTIDDAHSSPTYNGKYTYNPDNKKIEIQIFEENN
jgi:hypothetical protein